MKPTRRKKSRRKVQVSCLQQLFPSSCTLRNFFRRHSVNFENFPHYHKFMSLLDQVYIVPKEEELKASQLTEFHPLDRIEDVSISQIINVAVAQMIRSGPSEMQNVLSYGYRQKSMHSNDASVRNWLNLECRFVNTVHSLMLGSAWRYFVATVGTECFRFLLDYAMFLTSSNGSFLQLCGPPVSYLATRSSLSSTNIHGKGDSKILRFHLFYNTSPFRKLLPLSHSLIKSNAECLSLEIFGIENLDNTNNGVDAKSEEIATKFALNKFCQTMKENFELCDGIEAMNRLVSRQYNGDDDNSNKDLHNRKRKAGGTRRGCRGKRAKRQKLAASEESKQVKSSNDTRRETAICGVNNLVSDTKIQSVAYVEFLTRSISANIAIDSRLDPFHTQEDEQLNRHFCLPLPLKGHGNENGVVGIAAVQSKVQSPQCSYSNLSTRNQKSRNRKKWRRLLMQKVKSVMALNQSTAIVEEQLTEACIERSATIRAQIERDCGRNHNINRLYRPKVLLSTEKKRCLMSRTTVESAEQSNEEQQDTIQFAVPKKNVMRFLKAILLRLLPLQFAWGSRHNLNKFMRSVDSYICLGRHETMTLAQVMNELNVEDIPWLPAIAPHLVRQFLLSKFISWLFNRVIGIIIAQAFYVTEAEGYGVDVFYYEKHVWRRIVHEHYPEFQNRFVAVDPIASSDTTASTHTVNASRELNQAPIATAQRKNQNSNVLKKSSNLFNASIRNGSGSNVYNSSRGDTKVPPSSTDPGITTAKNAQYLQQRSSFLQSWSVKVAESSHLSRSMTVEQWNESKRIEKQIEAAKAKQYSTIRFVPKKSTLRGITNLRAKGGNVSGNNHFSSAYNADQPMVVTNSMLYNCLHVLKHVYDANASLRGFGVFGMDDIYREYRSYWNRLAGIYGEDSLKAGEVPLYMAAIDLQKCYDNINPVRLYDLVQEILLGTSADTTLSKTTSSSSDASTSAFGRTFSGLPSQQNPTGIMPPVSYSQQSASNFANFSRTTSAYGSSSASLSRTESYLQSNLVFTQPDLSGASLPQGHSQTCAGKPGKLPQSCLIHKYAVTHAMRSMERVVTKHLKCCVMSGDTIPFEDSGPEIAKRYRNSVIYDSVIYSKISAPEILRILKHHLFSQIVRMPSSLLDPQRHSPFCMQVKGIPQGSILSPILCHLYYGHVENMLFFDNESDDSNEHGHSLIANYEQEERKAEIAKLGWWKTSNPSVAEPQTMVIRLMDDYLVISTQAHCVQHFLQKAFDSYGEYGGSINPGKTKVNFPVQIRVAGGTDTLTLRPPWSAVEGDVNEQRSDSMDQQQLPQQQLLRQRQQQQQQQFSWCGLLVDTTTMELRPDLNRLLSRSLTTSVSIECSHPGVAFRRAVKSFFRMKCHALILDSSMHRVSTVIQSLQNLYQLTAARSFAYYQRLHRMYRVDLRPAYFLQCIREGILFAARLIRTRMRREISRKLHLEQTIEIANDDDGDSDSDSNQTDRLSAAPKIVSHFGECSVSVKMAIYLGWKAFRDVAVATRFRLHQYPRDSSIRSEKFRIRGQQDTSPKLRQHLDLVECCDENLSNVKECLTVEEWQQIELALTTLDEYSEESQLASFPKF